MNEDRVRSWTLPKGLHYFGVSTSSSPNVEDLANYDPYDAVVSTNIAYTGSETKTTTDRVTPNYKRAIASGAIINNPFSSKHSIVRGLPCAPFHHTYKSGSQYYRTSGIWRTSSPGYIPVDEAVTDALRTAVINSAVTQAYANIDTSEILALATAAESRKTIDSIASISYRAYKIFKNVRKLNFRALKKELSPKELSQRYMEARYALRPLAYDVSGIVAACEKQTGTVRKTFRGYASDSMVLSDTVEGGYNGLSYTETDFTRSHNYQVSARAGVLCDADVTRASILGIDKIPETAWELIPFSFVVDWFTNVGDYISAHTPNVGINQRASWVTVKEVLTRTIVSGESRSTIEDYGGEPVSLALPPFDLWSQESSLERVVDPQLNTFPSFDMNLDVFKITDLGIMLKQVLS